MVPRSSAPRVVSVEYLQRMMSPQTGQAFVRKVIDGIQAVVGKGPVGLHEPYFAGNEWAYLKECLDSTFVSSVGPFVDRFESALKAYTGAGHAVAVVNGTAALHLALRLVGVEPGDEVLTPALSFIATANAISYCEGIPISWMSERALTRRGYPLPSANISGNLSSRGGG